MNEIKIRHTSILIPDYHGDEDLERRLSVWNQAYFRYEPKGYSYNPDTNELLVPRGIDSLYLQSRFDMPIVLDHKHDEYDKISLNLKTEPRDDAQKRSIAFMIGEDDFKYTKKYSQLSLNADTGYGKTYVAIASMSFLKMKTIIITHIDDLKNQWIDEMIDKTNLTKKSICNIKGTQGMEFLLTLPNPNFKVYCINHRTVHNYAKKYGWDKVSEFFRHLKIGLKIFDEAHIEFENLINIDLYTNVKKTFYLTANFERSDYKENKLFTLCFKNVLQYGKQETQKKKKHINYLSVLYDSRPSVTDQMSIKTFYGFNLNSYTDYQLEKDIFYDLIERFIDMCIKNGGKILILISKINGADILYGKFKTKYPSIGIYHSKIKPSEKPEMLEKDIVISTSKSLGVGMDIYDLRNIINTEQYSSKILTNQVPGRLRNLGDDKKSVYIELIDVGFKTVRNMHKVRMKNLEEKCLSMKQMRIK